MKAYIQDLCGDEGSGTEQSPVDIDCAILQCMLQDAIFEKLVGNCGKDINFDTLTELKGVVECFKVQQAKYDL